MGISKNRHATPRPRCYLEVVHFIFARYIETRDIIGLHISTLHKIKTRTYINMFQI